MARRTPDFTPDWYEDVPPARSFRSILKWGSKTEFKHPNAHLVQLMMDRFGMTEADFAQKRELGLEQVPEEGHPPRLAEAHLEALIDLVGGRLNARTDVYSRLAVAYGKTMIDLMRLRKGIIEHLPDLVLHPRDRDDLRRIVDYCDTHRIPVYPFGGGSSVTRGVEAVKGGVTLDLRVHLKRVVRFDETNQTITVEGGMSGPELERILQDAPQTLGAKARYTCGHFPQSFEYSTVGGWVVTRGAGQNSTYYGKIEDLVLSQDYVCPAGDFVTGEYPAQSTGPDVDQLLMGSEGAFGVLYSATLRVRRYRPENTARFAFVFRDWESAKAAMREIMQGEFGRPSAFRLSDPEETDFGLTLYGVADTPVGRSLSRLGYRPGERCLLIGSADGDAAYTKLVKAKVLWTCTRHKALYLSGWVTKKWEHGRFRDPYMREDLQDHGVMIDTLECAVTWSQLERVHSGVRAFCKTRPNTVVMTHGSHFYEQGCNLYFIFVTRMDDLDEYRAYQAGILDAIQQTGAAMSHHHGIGKMTAPWLEGQVGEPTMRLFRALKAFFDPNGIMNPGGTLGLD